MNYPITPPAAVMRSPHSDLYPCSDGEPMADNTLQWNWIADIKQGLDHIFRERDDVFVAGDPLWYPVEGEPNIRLAPDVLVAFGRPKGHRGSYQQLNEDGVPPQVLFEIPSPSNRAGDMAGKRAFYERYGVEEYYVYDPDRRRLRGWRRGDGRFEPIADMNGWESPRLGVRFDLPEGEELQLTGPDGAPFLTFPEQAAKADAAERRAAEEREERLEAERRAADAERRAADAEQQAAEEHQERLDAERRAADAERRAAAENAERQRLQQEAEAARRKIEEMNELLRKFGLGPDGHPPASAD